MRKLNGKKIILWILSVILCVTACAPAFASAGDRTLLYLKSDDDAIFQAINFAYRIGDGFGIGLNGVQQKVLVYREIGGEPEEYEMERPAWDDEEAEAMMAEEGIDITQADEDSDSFDDGPGEIEEELEEGTIDLGEEF